jgi:hypothetical protein
MAIITGMHDDTVSTANAVQKRMNCESGGKMKGIQPTRAYREVGSSGTCRM